eukprot:437293-Pyramimonas_sp.AAC.1
MGAEMPGPPGQRTVLRVAPSNGMAGRVGQNGVKVTPRGTNPNGKVEASAPPSETTTATPTRGVAGGHEATPQPRTGS